MALKCMGYLVELAQDGDEVLSFVQTSRSEVSAIVLDIMMPNRDGIDTLREIRRIDPDLPVIMVSGASSTLNVVAAMKNGATDFLCKPVAHEDLSKALLRALDLKEGEYIRPPRSIAAAFRGHKSADERDSGAGGTDWVVGSAGSHSGGDGHRQRGDCAGTAPSV